MPLDDLFEKIATLDNLRKAWLKAKYFAETEAVFFDHFGYQSFDNYLESNLRVLRHELLSDDYRPSLLRIVTIPKGDEQRKIYFAAPRDAVVIQAVMNLVGPYFEERFSHLSFGNRLNVTDSEDRNPYQRWQERYNEYVTTVRQFLNSGASAWYLITDIANYYPSIDRDRLRGILAGHIRDEQVLRLINYFLELDAYDLGEDVESISGLPAGTIYAHFFANIYLMDFDELAEQYSLGYARYVDDICLVCSDEESLRTTEAILQDHLSRWEHRFKPEKTVSSPIRNWETLIEHTNKMKYAPRLDFMEFLDLSTEDIESARGAEYYFQRLYRIAEREGDINLLVQEAPAIIIQLRDLKVGDIGQLIYSLLETRPVKPAGLRVVLSVLLEEELPDLSQRFIEFFTSEMDNGGYLRMNLLQVLPHFTERGASLKDLLLSEFADDSNYLVRANAYTALKILADVDEIELTVSELGELRQNESSTFALSRLIDCYAAVDTGEVWAALAAAANSDSNARQFAVAQAFLQLLDEERISPSLIESILPVFIQSSS